jgi:hypothetical protein
MQPPSTRLRVYQCQGIATHCRTLKSSGDELLHGQHTDQLQTDHSVFGGRPSRQTARNAATVRCRIAPRIPRPVCGLKAINSSRALASGSPIRRKRLAEGLKVEFACVFVIDQETRHVRGQQFAQALLAFREIGPDAQTMRISVCQPPDLNACWRSVQVEKSHSQRAAAAATRITPSMYSGASPAISNRSSPQMAQ